MSQTSKKRKVRGVSIADRPFSSAEKKELQRILNNPYWARRAMKDEFASTNNRLGEEIDAYIAISGKRKKPAVKSEGSIIRNKAKAQFVEDQQSVNVPIDRLKKGKVLIIKIMLS